MVSMTTLPRTGLPGSSSRPFTRADLEQMPDDGRRYEILGGVLVVTPSPRPIHQRVSMELLRAMLSGCPDDLEIFHAPFGVTVGDDSIMEPDLIVVRRADVTPDELRGPLLLAVEILSPTTRRFDLDVKRPLLEAAGCPSFWVVDPEGPSVTIWELTDGAYVEVAHAEGDETCSVTRPFPVEIVPARLV